MRVVLAIAFSFFLLSCAMGPDYERPKTDTGERFRMAEGSPPGTSSRRQLGHHHWPRSARQLGHRTRTRLSEMVVQHFRNLTIQSYHQTLP